MSININTSAEDTAYKAFKQLQAESDTAYDAIDIAATKHEAALHVLREAHYAVAISAKALLQSGRDYTSAEMAANSAFFALSSADQEAINKEQALKAKARAAV